MENIDDTWLTDVQPTQDLLKLDPELANGETIAAFKEVLLVDKVPITVRKGEESTITDMKVRVLLLGKEHTPTEIKVHLTTDEDIFFHFACTLDQDTYCELI